VKLSSFRLLKYSKFFHPYLICITCYHINSNQVALFSVGKVWILQTIQSNFLLCQTLIAWDYGSVLRDWGTRGRGISWLLAVGLAGRSWPGWFCSCRLPQCLSCPVNSFFSHRLVSHGTFSVSANAGPVTHHITDLHTHTYIHTYTHTLHACPSLNLVVCHLGNVLLLF